MKYFHQYYEYDMYDINTFTYYAIFGAYIHDIE